MTHGRADLEYGARLKMTRLLVLLLVALSACTLLTQFPEEGQPCDTAAAPAEQCSPDFHCSEGKCVKGAFGDGGQ